MAKKPNETPVTETETNSETVAPSENEKGGGVANSPEFADVSEIASSVSNKQPEVNSDVDLGQEMETVSPAPVHEPAPESQPMFSGGQRDKDGTVWNPEIHASENNDGKTPIKRKNGLWAKKRGGASLKQKSKIFGGNQNSGTTGQLPDPNQLNTHEQAKADAMALGNVTADTIINIGLFISDDFQPKKTDQGVDERQALRETWAAYYLATGKKDLPPWMGLAIGNAAFIMPRLSEPKTRSRMGEFKAGVAGWWIKRKEAKAAKKAGKVKKPEQENKNPEPVEL